MIFYIDGKRQIEKHFWNCIQSIASERQIQMLLDGKLPVELCMNPPVVE